MRYIRTVGTFGSCHFAMQCFARLQNQIAGIYGVHRGYHIAQTIEAFSLNHHLYADDMQLRKNLRIVDINTTRVNMELCVTAIKDWCSTRRLQLNADNTELIWFGSRSNLKKLAQAETSLQLGSTTIEPEAVFGTSASIWITNSTCEYTSARWQRFVSFIFVVFANFDMF